MKYSDQNFCTEGATVVTASSADANFTTANLKHPFRSKVWRSTGCTSEWIVWDFATIQPIDMACFFLSKEAGPKLTSGAILTLQANATNTWSSPAFSQTLTINNTYAIASCDFTTAQNYRYWRLTIQDPLNAFGYVELGVGFIAGSTPIQNANNGFKFSLTDLSVSTATAFGHRYTDLYPLQAQLDFVYENIDDSALSLLENSYRRCGTYRPVLFVLDPSGVAFDKNHFVMYGTFTTAYGATQQLFNIFTSDSLSVVEMS